MIFVLTSDVQTVIIADGCEVGIRSVSAHGNPDRLMPGVSIGHGQLPTAPLVVGIVLRTLRSVALSPPRASDCRSLQALGSSGS